MRLELHADDLGASAGINKNIIFAWKLGAIDGVSVLANGDALHEAAEQINSRPDLPLRVVAHLNLSEGRPTAQASEVPLLVNEDGKLFRGFLGLWLLWLKSDKAGRAALLNEVETEWRAQIDAIRRAVSPRNVQAVDGHIHVHMLPFLFEVAARLAREADISEIRISREIRHFSFRDTWRPGCAANLIKHQLLRLLAGPAERTAGTYGLGSPNAVAGLLYSGRMSRSAIEAAVAAARRSGIEWLEVICHPGRASADEESRWAGRPELAGFYRSANRDLEYEAMLQMRSTA